MKSFLRKDARSFYFVFCLIFFCAVITYRIVSGGTSLLNTFLLIFTSLLNVASAGFSLYEVRKRENLHHES